LPLGDKVTSTQGRTGGWGQKETMPNWGKRGTKETRNEGSDAEGCANRRNFAELRKTVRKRAPKWEKRHGKLHPRAQLGDWGGGGRTSPPRRPNQRRRGNLQKDFNRPNFAKKKTKQHRPTKNGLKTDTGPARGPKRGDKVQCYSIKVGHQVKKQR